MVFGMVRICLLFDLCRARLDLREVDYGACHMVDVVHEVVEDDVGDGLHDLVIHQAADARVQGPSR
jgi:hypothetical protein